MRWFRRKITPSEAAKVLSDAAHFDERERIRARAREMREEMGLPPSRWLESRK